VWLDAHRTINLAGSYQRPPVGIVVNERPAGSSAHVVAHVPSAGVVVPTLLAGVPVALGAAQGALTRTVRNVSVRVIFIYHSALSGLEPDCMPLALFVGQPVKLIVGDPFAWAVQPASQNTGSGVGSGVGTGGTGVVTGGTGVGSGGTGVGTGGTGVGSGVGVGVVQAPS